MGFTDFLVQASHHDSRILGPIQRNLRRTGAGKKWQDGAGRLFEMGGKTMSEQIEALPTHKLVSCPQCGEQFHRAIVWWDGREIMADRGCLCDGCEATREAAAAAADARSVHLARWREIVPDDYHRATVEDVPTALRLCLEWRPAEGCRRMGIVGDAGKGKTMVVALLVKDFLTQFQWTNGFAARSIYTKAVTADETERKAASKAWLRLVETPLLVLDDVDKGNFTEAWASALFDLLESRNGKQLSTIWTANLGPGRLAAKIGRCGDPEMANAIERRLCMGAKLIHAK
jgi:hypothetical protein